MKIAVLRDDLTNPSLPDAADTLAEAGFVEKILTDGNDVRQIPFYADLEKTMGALQSYAPDVVFNLTESVCSQGGLAVFAPQLLDILRMPYTGNSTFAHLVSADKDLAKRLFLQNGLPAPSSVYRAGASYLLKAKTEHASAHLDDSCVVCPASEDELQDALKQKERETGLAWIAEEYIDGREFNVALLGDEVLPPAEMRFFPDFKGHRILTYEAKWNEDCDAYQLSRRSFDVEAGINQKLSAVALKCKDVLDLRGYTRIDFRMNTQGELFIIDLNTNPCIAPDSGFIAMAHEAGLSDKEVIERIVADAFSK